MVMWIDILLFGWVFAISFASIMLILNLDEDEEPSYEISDD